MPQKILTPDSSSSNFGKNEIEIKGRPLVVGEVLFDVMPDGTRVLGGAPFNVAWHLQAFGSQPLMITRVGDDDGGDEVVEAMEAWGMDTTGVQRDDAHPTGRVQIDLDNGEPSFRILPDQAYDHLDRDRLLELLVGKACSLLYHGSLISRSDVSRRAVDALRDESDIPIFIDVNLRNPWWKKEGVLESIRRARWAKVNESELALLTGKSDLAAAESFRVACELEALIVTRGGRSAVVVDARGGHDAAPPPEVRVVDTVGAGDAFCAVFIFGLVHGWPTEVSLSRALEFAAAVCEVPGATTADRELYARFEHHGWW
jgi:fructokinase